MLTAGIATVSADETSSVTTHITTSATTVAGEEAKVAVPEVGREAKTAPGNEGLEVKEAGAKKQDSRRRAAAKDYEKQVTDINKTVADYKGWKWQQIKAYEKKKLKLMLKMLLHKANYDKRACSLQRKLTAYKKN